MSLQKRYKFEKTRSPIPFDLLYIIIQELLSNEQLGSLAKLCCVSKELYSYIIPLLYTNVHIKSDEQLQSFLTLPQSTRIAVKEEKQKQKQQITKNLVKSVVLSVKRNRSRSNSLERNSNNSNNANSENNGNISINSKIYNLNLMKELKLDIYPSRRSFKLSSKLPSPLSVDKLFFTSLALKNLYDKLNKSNAPKILVSFWSSHLPTLIKPKKVIIDYSNLNLMGDNDETYLKDENWLDTMTGMSFSLQSWSPTTTTTTTTNTSSSKIYDNNYLKEIELIGNNWFGILPSPGVKVKMIHTDFIEDSNQLAEQEQVETQEEDLVTVNETILNTPSNETDEIVELIEKRKKIIKKRVESLIMGLRSSQALYETYQSNQLINWNITDILPPQIKITNDIRSKEEIENEEYSEKRKIINDILIELDEKCPNLTKRYSKIGSDGRRELSCLTLEQSND
ncbi:uncharacterized protein L201_007965 [Kwoniella dendrophila CBS 6074]|uniref:F-box domain-containing protein n=1 Tax=Kwoniella dendrophila CBS 6074 TaxID=1295534 RepID=A0AAX4K5L1_9TREE